MMSSMFLACVLSVTAPGEAQVMPLQGAPIRGEIVELSHDGIRLQSADGPVNWEAKAMHAVRFLDAGTGTPTSPPPILVELVDDSVLNATAFVASGGMAVLDLQEGAACNIRSPAIRAVRFHRQDESMRKQWNEIAGGTRRGDVLVIRKSHQAGADRKEPVTMVLDQIEGIVQEVKPDKVVFEFDGNKVDVPRAKVEGVLYRQQPDAPASDPACTVRGLAGEVWNVREMKLEEGKLQLTTVAGARMDVPLSRIKEVDFSAANLVFLSDLEPESVDWHPYFRSITTPDSLVRWFGPKRDRGADGLPLTLNGESYEKGLALHSRTQLSFRLTRNYRRFLATVGIAEEHRNTADLRFVVMGDERTLLDRSMTGAQQAFELSLDVEGVRRIKILVDFGDDRSDVGDLLYLCNARLAK